MSMKKYIAILVLLISFVRKLEAQRSIIDSNTVLFDNLEARYKNPCLEFKERQIRKNVVRIDNRLIDELNRIYHSEVSFSQLINLLVRLGYVQSTRIIRPEWMNDTATFTKVNLGQINGYVQVIYDIKNNQLVSKQIILTTKKPFFCETKELWSSSAIDFVYLRRFLKKFKIPLKVSSTLSELESK